MKQNKSLSETHPHLLEEWDYDKNYVLGLNPGNLTYGSNKKAAWVCKSCCYCWMSSICNRTIGKRGCSACSGNIVSDKNRLSTLYPHLVKEWHFTLNDSLRPDSVSYASHKKVWWKCSYCDKEWESSISNRSTKGKGCYDCSLLKRALSRVKSAAKVNNFYDKYPELAKEWHPTKNGSLTSRCVSCHSNKKVWWLCSVCGRDWESIVNNRTLHGSSCPDCSQLERSTSYISTISKRNNFFEQYTEIAKEWHSVLNGNLSPVDFSPGYHYKAWWICSLCGNEWPTMIKDRVFKGSRCPLCAHNSISKISQEWLDKLGISKEYREFPIKIDGKLYKVDGFNPETNEVSEFLGDLWHGNPKIFSAGGINPVNKKSFGELYDQTFQRFVELENAGYKVVYIWESDYKEGKTGSNIR